MQNPSLLSAAGLITHGQNVLADMAYAETQGYPLTRTLDELQEVLDLLREKEAWLSQREHTCAQAVVGATPGTRQDNCPRCQQLLAQA